MLEEANESLDIVNTNLGDRAIREVRDEMPFDDPLVVILRPAREPRAPIVEPPSGLLSEGGRSSIMITLETVLGLLHGPPARGLKWR